jgi:dipeptidyl aminopeptidase/acylaminoacyl peptidase
MAVAPAEKKVKQRAGPRPGYRPFFLLAGTALAIFLAATVWLAFYPPLPLDLDGAPNLDERARKIMVPLVDDHLDGWMLHGPRRTVVVLFHGYGRDHHRAWRYGAFLHQAGYDVVTVDFRSSRARRRLPTTLGAHELADAEATLAWVKAEPSLRGHRIVLFGESLGGSVALATAARSGGVAAVIADCPFATGRRALEDTFNYWLRVPGGPVAELASTVGRGVTGRDPGALDAVAAAESLRTTPLFLIHARDDDRMRAQQAEDLWRAAGSQGELWMTEGGHNEGWQRSRGDYERRVLQFLDRALATPPASDGKRAAR